jgi:hypothetical protein
MTVEKLVDRALFCGDDPAHETAFRTLAADDRPVAHFDRPRSPTRTTLAVVSDPHVSVDETGTWKMYHTTRRRFRETLADVERRGVDGVVVPGDLTKDGEERNLDWVASALADVSVPVLAVPGNHDVKGSTVATFERQFADGGYPIERRLGGVDVLGLNSAMTPGSDGGETAVVSDDQLDRLDAALDGSSDPIVVSHHNLPGLGEHIGGPGWDWAPHPPVENADAVLSVLSRHDVPLHLSGHVHVLSLVRARGVRGLIAPALSSFPQSYGLLEIDETGTTVRCRTTASPEEIEAAYEGSLTHSDRSEVISGLNAEQLRDLPVVDERRSTGGEIRSICT